MSLQSSNIGLPNLPVILPVTDGVIWLDDTGEVMRISPADAKRRLSASPALFCHRQWVAARLKMDAAALNGADALELFAFVRPARFCVPTVTGMAQALGLESSSDDEAQVLLIPHACLALLRLLEGLLQSRKDDAAKIATLMSEGGWEWGPAVLAALGSEIEPSNMPNPKHFDINKRLDDIPPAPATIERTASPLKESAVIERLSTMLGKNAEIRPNQKAYACGLIPAFSPPQHKDGPTVVLAEAGTGTGKTLGYLAASTVWSEENKSPVWISTYTRNLQHQIIEEMRRYYPDREERERKVVIRKGRQNYLCLLNFDDALGEAAAQPRTAIALGLMARWTETSSDGDLAGADFPAWLIDLLGYRQTLGLADRRGECIHSACRHYSKCFVEKSRARARHADIIVANHALVMVGAVNAAMLPPTDENMPDDNVPNTNTLPTHYVFDESHHVFDAADSAFSILLSGRETADLRRWIRGSEGRLRSRGKGLRKRLEDILINDKDAIDALDEMMEAATILPRENWLTRINDEAPEGVVETLLYEIKIATHRRNAAEGLYSLEEPLYYPVDTPLLHAAQDLSEGLTQIATAVRQLIRAFVRILANESSTPNTDSQGGDSQSEEPQSGESEDNQSRARVEAAIRGLNHRLAAPVNAWLQLLNDMTQSTPENSIYVDWMQITRSNGKDIDIGIHRHHLDPSIAFSAFVLKPAEGVVMTSATLTDTIITDYGTEQNWDFAKKLTGAEHLPTPAIMNSVASPFDYARQTRVFVVNDLERNNTTQTALALAQLMQASKGGGLGLFTAIQRLRAVHPMLSKTLNDAGIPLYAQHMDNMNLQTLLQIFREDRQACLLGTDAVRDGIDVPGEALRLIVFDRMPWPRPNTLFQARANYFGRNKWSDRITRMRLRQAFGRLVRQGDDVGVFVMLDNGFPSKMLSAFPDGIVAKRCPLDEAVDETRLFLR